MAVGKTSAIFKGEKMATQINNTAGVTYGYGRSGLGTSSSNIASTNLIEEYAISSIKSTLNSGFRPGDNITYMITVRNDGTAPLFNVQISDDLANTNLLFVEGSGMLNINGTNTEITPTSTDSNLVFTLPQSLAGGDQATITYVAKVSPLIGTAIREITNTATVTAHEVSDSGTLITVSPNPSVTLQIDDYADLVVNKDVSANEIVPGQQFSYTITLENSGNLIANNVVLTDVLPTNFTISSITSLSNGELTTYDASGYTVGDNNTLTLPTGSGTAITVPAAVGGVSGTTTITITGSISE